LSLPSSISFRQHAGAALPSRPTTNRIENQTKVRYGIYCLDRFWLPVFMPGDDVDPLSDFRGRLQQLFTLVRQPTYRSLEAHANRDGRALPPSTVSGLLNGPVVPRWDTVETFVRACAHYARAHQIRLDPEVVNLDRWHGEYRALENALAGQAADRERIAGRAVPARRRRLAMPAQLPADVPAFTGRVDHLIDLDELLRAPANSPEVGGRPTTVVITAIDGTAGVGKTALAVHWAHQVRDRFPDGQLYVNLRGFDPSGQSMDPATAVRGFLDALEVPPQRVPVDPDAQAALYRSLLVDKRMLVVADNARDTAQVRPLLPGAPGCLVVVTSRNQLTGLVAAHAAHPLALDLLTPDEARQLLAHRLGAGRTAAEPHAVDEIITACARLPLALALVAAHAALRPDTPLHTLAEQLRDSQHRWHLLTGDDPTTDVQAVFSWSYQALTPPAARLFRLLGLHPGPGIGVPAAASLTGLPVNEARSLLDGLARASLLTEHLSGRYTLHDLLRAYATQLAHSTDTDTQRRTATHRILDYYLHTAYTADRQLAATRDPLVLSPPQPGAIPEHPADHAQALAWLTTERRVLLAAVDHAAATGFDTHTWQLAWALANFLDRRGHWHDWAGASSAAAAAAQRLADPTAQTHAHRTLARAYTRLGRLDDAHTELSHTLDLAARAGDSAGQAHTHHNLAILWERRGQPAQALDHARYALDLFRAVGHQTGQAESLNAVGWYETLLGNHQQAIASCQEALTLLQGLNDHIGQADTWDSLGYAHHHLGHHPQAVTCYQHALDLYRDSGDRFNEADTLTHLGNTHQTAGNDQAARDAWQHALTILTDLDHPDADTVRTKLNALDTQPRSTS
jgi:tetratricopeptide (TPR) repeat protein